MGGVSGDEWTILFGNDIEQPRFCLELQPSHLALVNAARPQSGQLAVVEEAHGGVGDKITGESTITPKTMTMTMTLTSPARPRLLDRVPIPPGRANPTRSSAEPVPEEVSPKSESSSWTTLPDPSSETSRAPSESTTSLPCWSLSERPGTSCC